MDPLVQDIRYALRQLARNPGFAIAATVTLALGIGATTAIFSAVHAILLRPLPYPEPDRLVALWESHPDRSTRNIVSSGSYLDWRDRATTFEGLAAYSGRFGLGLTGRGEPIRVTGRSATPNLFMILGISADRGRVFLSEEAEVGGEAVLLISHGLWQRQFGGDPAVLGQTVTLNEHAYTIVGVLPQEFDFPSPGIDVWFPLRFDEDDRAARTSHRWRVLGRLKPQSSLAMARAEMETIAAQLRKDYPEDMAGWRVRVEPYRADLTRDVQPALLLLLGFVGLVLLIACANVANLFLARALSRKRELGVRSALGAGRRRLAGQLLTESGVLAVLGGALGLGLVYAGLETLISVAPAGIPLLQETRIDPSVLAFAAGITLGTTLIFGLMPALRVSRGDPATTLRATPGSGGQPRSSLRSALLAGEVALSLVLLVAAGLLVRSFLTLQRVEYGFDPEGLLAVSLDLPGSRYSGTEDHRAFYESLLSRVRALPGVVSVTGTPEPPIVGFNNTFSFIIENRPRPGPNPREVPVEVRPVPPGYFRTMRIPLVRGRAIRESDGAEAERVAVVNEALARAHWPAGDAVGARITFDDEGRGPWVEIVGVVKDTRHYGLERPAEPALYVPYDQKRWGWMSWMTLMVRTAGDPLSLAEPMKRAVWELDDELPIHRLEPVTELYRQSNAERRFITLLVGAFASLALLLGALGTYSVVSYTVSGRRREIAVRIALGAGPRGVTASVLGDGARVTAVGITLGLVLALALSRLMAGLLYEVTPADPTTFLGVIGLLLAVTLAASLIPARRAARVDPMRTLKLE